MDCISANPDVEPYYFGVMLDGESVYWNSNPKDELRYKHLVIYLSLSLLMAYIITKLTHNRVVDLQSHIIGKGGIMIYP